MQTKALFILTHRMTHHNCTLFFKSPCWFTPSDSWEASQDKIKEPPLTQGTQIANYTNGQCGSFVFHFFSFIYSEKPFEKKFWQESIAAWEKYGLMFTWRKIFQNLGKQWESFLCFPVCLMKCVLWVEYMQMFVFIKKGWENSQCAKKNVAVHK